MTKKLTDDLKEILHSERVAQFLNVARHFIKLVETETMLPDEFYHELYLALIDLYQKGVNLPYFPVSYMFRGNGKNALERKRSMLALEEKGLSIIKKRNKSIRKIIEELEKIAPYWFVFNPVCTDETESIQATLAEDFRGIYGDLSRGISKIELGYNYAVKDALYELKFGFSNHWGNHCIDAIRVLHYLWYSGMNNYIKKRTIEVKHKYIISQRST